MTKFDPTQNDNLRQTIARGCILMTDQADARIEFLGGLVASRLLLGVSLFYVGMLCK